MCLPATLVRTLFTHCELRDVNRELNCTDTLELATHDRTALATRSDIFKKFHAMHSLLINLV